MLHSGVFDLSWWELLLVALALTHITIVCVTVFLHRCQAHRALDLHPAVSHFFRLWLWLNTGMITREWAAVHRKHHAKCETADDPHSPQVLGIGRVLWAGALLYTRETYNRETIERYGHGTPDDWIERNLYSHLTITGLTIMAATDILLFGLLPGLAIWLVQVLWIPFWAAGVINGIGHWFGYRNWPTTDASKNILPIGILIGGEELHNNHHAYGTSAKLSSKWYEFDIGWMYIRILETVGLATVKKVAPTPRFTAAKQAIDQETLHAVITNRYDVLAKFAKSFKAIYAEEIGKLRHFSPHDVRVLRRLKRWLNLDEKVLNEPQRAELAVALAKHSRLETVYHMKRDLAALWERSNASGEQLLKQLQDWCYRAESSGIRPLQEFSQRLRSYA